MSETLLLILLSLAIVASLCLALLICFLGQSVIPSWLLPRRRTPPTTVGSTVGSWVCPLPPNA